MIARLALLAAAVLGAVAVLVTAPSPVAGQLGEAVQVRISPTDSELALGDRIDVRIEVTNQGAVATPPLVVHIDITDPAVSESIDPEDWTPTLSRTVGALDAGASTTVDWTLQPISPGRFSVYAVVLSGGVEDLAASNVATVQVADRRSLNPDGILPVAIAVPVAIGLLLALQLRRDRWSRRQDPVGR